MIWVAALTTWLGVLFTLPAVNGRVSPVVPRLIRYVGIGAILFVAWNWLFQGHRPTSDLPWFLMVTGFVAEAITNNWVGRQVTPKA